MYASLYEFIQPNNSQWESSCETVRSALDVLNGTTNLSAPNLPRECDNMCCTCMHVCNTHTAHTTHTHNMHNTHSMHNTHAMHIGAYKSEPFTVTPQNCKHLENLTRYSAPTWLNYYVLGHCMYTLLCTLVSHECSLLVPGHITEDEIPLTSFITDPGGLRQFLISNWSLSPDLVDALLNSSIKLQSVSAHTCTTHHVVLYGIYLISVLVTTT